jgi:hypothetical protein
MTAVTTFLAGFGLGTIMFPLGFWFWLFLIADIIWMSWLVSDGDTSYRYDTPSTGLATVALVFTAVILQVFTKIKILSLIIANPGPTLLIFGLYVLIGVGWSFIKWTTLLLDWRTRNKECVINADNRIKNLETSLAVSGLSDLKKVDIQVDIKNEKDSLKRMVPTANKHKMHITAWMAYWPWSLLWTCVTDYIRRFFQRLYQVLESSYDSVQRHILKDFYKA